MKRIADPYILKLIREWLKAGVVHGNETTYPGMGTPQGGVISPLLANIYLNELDTLWVKRRMNDRQGPGKRNDHAEEDHLPSRPATEQGEIKNHNSSRGF